MAATSRRPRLACYAVLIVSLIAAGCSLLKPEVSPADKQEHAARLAREGKHADAARAYADLATQLPAESDNYQLLSAEQWVAAANVPAAKQAFAQVSPAARTTLSTPRALVGAEIAYAENDPTRAIRELDQIPVPTSPEQAQNYYWIRGRSAFLTGHPVEGTRALVERERYLSDPGALRANREELFNRVRTAAERGAPMKPPAKTDPVVAGWLDLGPVAVELERNPARASAALDNWKRQYPQHPANASVLSTAQTEIAVATEYPNQIALLLPLSGRGEPLGVAVRDGFIAAYLQQNAATRPQLKIYDVGAESVGAAYSRAITEGAGFVVGPLTKEDVAAVAPVSAGRTPVLALNFLSDSLIPAHNFYQFALLPEDEARIVARRVVADGRLAGVCIVPIGEWGNRVAAAFADELKSLGGTVLDSQRYEPSQPDFSDIIKQVLQVKVTKGEPSTHRSRRYIRVRGGDHRGPGTIDHSAIEVSLCRRRAGVFHIGQLRTGSERQYGHRRHVVSRHAVDDRERSGNRPDSRRRARGVAGAHRPPRPAVRLWFRRVSLSAQLALEFSGLKRDRRGHGQAASRRSQ